jgi:hypothetical protein
MRLCLIVGLSLAAQLSGQIRFEDIAARAGVHFELQNGATGNSIR